MFKLRNFGAFGAFNELKPENLTELKMENGKWKINDDVSNDRHFEDESPRNPADGKLKINGINRIKHPNIFNYQLSIFNSKKRYGFTLDENTEIISEDINLSPLRGKYPPEAGERGLKRGCQGLKRGFTLAEVLIALVVLGVIAAITIPTLIQNSHKKEYVSALKKTHSVLSQTTQQIIMEEGLPKCTDGGWACSMSDVYNMYKKYLYNAKECGSAPGCMVKDYKFLNGSPFGNFDGRGEFGQSLILADGTILEFNKITNSPEFQDCQISWNNDTNICFGMLADINGEKKPNQAGRDLFGFLVKEDGGLVPVGCKKNCSNGIDCTCKVIRENAMNY